MAPSYQFDRENKIRVKRNTLWTVEHRMMSTHELIESAGSKLNATDSEDKNVEALQNSIEESTKLLDDLMEAQKLLEDEITKLEAEVERTTYIE